MWLKFAPHFTYLKSEEETNNEQNMLEKIVKNVASNQSLNDGFFIVSYSIKRPFPFKWPQSISQRLAVLYRFDCIMSLAQCHTEEIKYRYPLVTFFYEWRGEGVVCFQMGTSQLISWFHEPSIPFDYQHTVVMDDKKCLQSFLFEFWLAGYNATFVKILKNSAHIKMEGDFLTTLNCIC